MERAIRCFREFHQARICLQEPGIVFDATGIFLHDANGRFCLCLGHLKEFLTRLNSIRNVIFQHLNP